MFWRYVATGLSTLMLLVGVFMLDCTYRFLGPLPDDPLQLCLRAEINQPGSALTLAVGFVAVSINLLALTWLPFVLDTRQREEDELKNQETLETNTYRVPEHVVGTLDLEPPDDHVAMELPRATSPLVDQIPDGSADRFDTSGSALVASGLSRRIDLIEGMLTSQSISPQHVTQRWIGLLNEANSLHNRGILETADFMELNTRLLSLFEGEPVNDAELAEDLA